jgi:hypothetical protein
MKNKLNNSLSMLRIITFLAIVLSLKGCSFENEVIENGISFYYWKQTVELTNEQKTVLKENNTDRLYIRFFDVVLDKGLGQITPVSKVEFKYHPNVKVVPCVFIQNDVFHQDEDNAELARNIQQLIKAIAAKNKIPISEIQLDCDWTKGTKLAYFEFLTTFQKLAKEWQVTPTIRLHQIKYKQSMGIPPAPKGLLMCYNMDDIDQIATPNSIVSSQVLKTYVTDKTSYPLELDLALPIYQWALIFRLGELVQIVNDIPYSTLKKEVFQKVGQDTYKVRYSTTIKNIDYYKGDIVKFEDSNPQELIRSAGILKSSQLKIKRLIFYHLSQDNLNQYRNGILQKILSTFS